MCRHAVVPPGSGVHIPHCLFRRRRFVNGRGNVSSPWLDAEPPKQICQHNQSDYTANDTTGYCGRGSVAAAIITTRLDCGAFRLRAGLAVSCYLEYAFHSIVAFVGTRQFLGGVAFDASILSGKDGHDWINRQHGRQDGRDRCDLRECSSSRSRERSTPYPAASAILNILKYGRVSRVEFPG